MMEERLLKIIGHQQGKHEPSTLAHMQLMQIGLCQPHSGLENPREKQSLWAGVLLITVLVALIGLLVNLQSFAKTSSYL